MVLSRWSRQAGHTSDGVNSLDLETSTLERVDEPSKGSGSVGAREDVLVHEQSPDEVLVLPALTQTSDLQEEGAIVLEHVVDLLQEGREVPDTDVLSHLEAGDLVVLSSGDGGVAVIHAENLGLGFGGSVAAKATVAPGGLVASEGDTGNVCAKVLGSETSERSPTTTEIQHPFTRLQADLAADGLELVVLKFLESLLLVGVRDKTGSVDHAWAQEPSVEVVTAVVVVTDLFLIYEAISTHVSRREALSRGAYPGSVCA